MKRWIYERFLPMWAKETLLKDYRQLCRENTRLRRTLREREAYIKGMRENKCRMQNAHIRQPLRAATFSRGEGIRG